MDFGRRSLAGAALAVAGWAKGTGGMISSARADTAPAGPITLPELPWAAAALEPVISARTVGFHYGKHHRAYVEATNRLIAGTHYADMPLRDIVKKSALDPQNTALFNNAAQVWNHDFYWQSLAPKSGGKPGAEMSARIIEAFGSYDNFQKQYIEIAAAQFGSGWVWLGFDRTAKKLVLQPTANAGTPIIGDSLVPLSVLDVWEHAYYLDYQNSRRDHVAAVVDKLLNWRFVEKNLEQA